MAKLPKRVADSAKVRVCIDGIALQTTAGLLRRGAISVSLANAWSRFEEKYAERPIMGLSSTYPDNHLNRSINIQFDLY